MKPKRVFALITAFVMVMLVIAPLIVLKSNIKEENKVIYALDTVINISAYGQNSENALREVHKRIYEIDNDFNAHSDTSYVYKINENAGIQPVKVSDDVFYVIENALAVSRLTDGAFDITVKPAADLWQISNGGYIPTEDELDGIKQLIGYQNVELDYENKTVFLKNKGMAIDLGGIAKGYAGDEAKRILKEFGVESAVCDFGGNVVLVGEKPSIFSVGKNWKVGIKTPFSKTGEYFAVVKEKDTSLVTSGAYERYFEKDGNIYHHIIDPKTLMPSRSDVKSVTVVCESSMLADALSTAVFVMGCEKGMDLINSISDCDVICIGGFEKIFASDKIKAENRLEITDNSYELG